METGSAEEPVKQCPSIVAYRVANLATRTFCKFAKGDGLPVGPQMRTMVRIPKKFAAGTFSRWGNSPRGQNLPRWKVFHRAILRRLAPAGTLRIDPLAMLIIVKAANAPARAGGLRRFRGHRAPPCLTLRQLAQGASAAASELGGG